eukprot:TRINITY_DN37245_c0_g1_i1.p1 TRINITY_DN37245_c0_g1~~TRINITY_DN37245_c0_g1_i1.p1  ORF type:complete len:280 (+),score=44.31 TRINITY_DN37245_c0_g1_i1:88-927(+)
MVAFSKFVDLVGLETRLRHSQRTWHMAPAGVCVIDVTAALAALVGLDPSWSIDLICGSECLDVATPVVQLVGVPITAVIRRGTFVEALVESACRCPAITGDEVAKYTRMLKVMQEQWKQLHAERDMQDDFTTVLLSKLQVEFEASHRALLQELEEAGAHARHVAPESSQRLARLCVLTGSLYDHEVFHKTSVITIILRTLLSSPYGALPHARQVHCACMLFRLAGQRMRRAQSGRTVLPQIASRLEDLANHAVFGMYTYADETRAAVFELRQWLCSSEA